MEVEAKPADMVRSKDIPAQEDLIPEVERYFPKAPHLAAKGARFAIKARGDKWYGHPDRFVPRIEFEGSNEKDRLTINSDAPRYVARAKASVALTLQQGDKSLWPGHTPYSFCQPAFSEGLSAEAESWFPFIQMTGWVLCDGFSDVTRNYTNTIG